MQGAEATFPPSWQPLAPMDASDDAGSRGLTIGIDARAATEVKAGRGRVVRELLRALGERNDPNTYVCFARERWQEQLDERFRWCLISAPDPLWHVRTAAAASRACDVFLSTNSYLTVLMLRVPSVAIVYDLVPFNPTMRPNRRSALIERLTLGRAVRRADALWCISQATADALTARFPRAQGKAAAVPLAVSPRLSTSTPEPRRDLPEPGFVLAVGTLEPRKNLPRLVDAYARLPRALQQAHPLVVVGAAGWSTGPTLTALRSLGDRCLLLGHISDEALAQLYRTCGVFCYPSLGEGFGLPVLEAMAAGAAVVTSNLSSLPEVGGDAVEYVDPYSPESIGDGLERVLSSAELRDQLASRAQARASRFSWDRTAADVLALLAQAAKRRT
jgi:glycosyltransferase involved in cell wall biosynthesis